MGLSAGAFDAAGGAVSDIFGAIGDFSEADAYKKAAEYSHQNAELEAESTAIQMQANQRQIFKTIGMQKAQYAGAGLAESGSAVDVLRSSQQQGSLQMQLVHTQGLINQNAYLEQEAANKGMAAHAEAAGAGGIFGGLLKGAEAGLMIAGVL